MLASVCWSRLPDMDNNMDQDEFTINSSSPSHSLTLSVPESVENTSASIANLKTDPPTCSQCGKQFANIYRLQRHQLSHSDGEELRIHRCTQCSRAFKFKHHLKEHIRIHTGEKPFECKHCGTRFSHSGSYSSHMSSKKCTSRSTNFISDGQPSNPSNNNGNSTLSASRHQGTRFPIALEKESIPISNPEGNSRISQEQVKQPTNDRGPDNQKLNVILQNNLPGRRKTDVGSTPLATSNQNAPLDLSISRRISFEDLNKIEPSSSTPQLISAFPLLLPSQISPTTISSNPQSQMLSSMETSRNQSREPLQEQSQSLFQNTLLSNYQQYLNRITTLMANQSQTPIAPSLPLSTSPFTFLLPPPLFNPMTSYLGGPMKDQFPQSGRTQPQENQSTPPNSSENSTRKDANERTKTRKCQSSKDNLHVCDECNKAFSKYSSLSRHKYEHTGVRPYVCQVCEKAFKHRHHLTEHIRLHTGEKPFKCQNCGKTFSHSGSYSQHMTFKHRCSRDTTRRDSNENDSSNPNNSQQE